MRVAKVNESFVHQTEEESEIDTVKDVDLANMFRMTYSTSDGKPIEFCLWNPDSEYENENCVEYFESKLADDTFGVFFSKKVLRIGKHFIEHDEDKRRLKTMVLPDCIESIQEGAFSTIWTDLVSLTLPKSLKYIEDDAIKLGNHKEKEVIFQETPKMVKFKGRPIYFSEGFLTIKVPQKYWNNFRSKTNLEKLWISPDRASTDDIIYFHHIGDRGKMVPYQPEDSTFDLNKKTKYKSKSIGDSKIYWSFYKTLNFTGYGRFNGCFPQMKDEYRTTKSDFERLTQYKTHKKYEKWVFEEFDEGFSISSFKELIPHYEFLKRDNKALVKTYPTPFRLENKIRKLDFKSDAVIPVLETTFRPNEISTWYEDDKTIIICMKERLADDSGYPDYKKYLVDWGHPYEYNLIWIAKEEPKSSDPLVTKMKKRLEKEYSKNFEATSDHKRMVEREMEELEQYVSADHPNLTDEDKYMIDSKNQKFNFDRKLNESKKR